MSMSKVSNSDDARGTRRSAIYSVIGIGSIVGEAVMEAGVDAPKCKISGLSKPLHIASSRVWVSIGP